MVRIIKPAAAAGFQIIDPRQAVLLNEVMVEPKALDDEIVRVPADGAVMAARALMSDQPEIFVIGM